MQALKTPVLRADSVKNNKRYLRVGIYLNLTTTIHLPYPHHDKYLCKRNSRPSASGWFFRSRRRQK